MAAGDVTIDAVIDIGKNKRLVLGAVVLDGGNPTPVTLSGYLDSVTRAVVTPNVSTTPTLGAAGVPFTVRGVVAACALNVYAFANTANNDATPIASTDNTLVVAFAAWGTVHA